jgi:ATP-binding cassette subfamily C protein
VSLLAYLNSRFIRDQKIELAKRMFTAYMTGPYAFHLDHNTAELLRNANLEVRVVGNQVLNPLLQLILKTITALAIIVLLLVVEPVVSLVVVSVLGLASLLFMRLTRHKMEVMGEEEQRQRKVSYKVMKEGYGSIKAVKVLNKASYFIDEFVDSFYKSNTAQLVKGVVGSLTRPFMEVMAVSGMLLVSFSVVLFNTGVDSLIPTLGLFGVAIIKLQGSITGAVSSFTSLKYSNYAINPVYDDLSLLEEKKPGEADAGEESARPPISFEDRIEIESLYFRYHETDEFVLKDVNMSIPKGSSVGIVGTTGAGKSTVIDILLGLFEPTKGQVCVDGTDISDRITSWQSLLGYIPQDIFLLDNSIKRNIALGVYDEDIDWDNFEKALEMAQIGDMVRALPEGLETHTGERGVRLSGGQLQRVGIARALYNDPEVLVMDEATSSLDTSTEKMVMSALEKAKQGRTFIMIAHRLSTVKNCDIIYFLEDGEVADSGTYDYLAANSAGFKQMIADDQ